MSILLDDLASNDPKRAKEAEEILKKELPTALLPQILRLAVDRKNALAADCACNVLASFRNQEQIGVFLLDKLLSKDALIREQAAWVLKTAPQSRALDQLRACATKDENENIRILCLHALRTYAWNNPGSEIDFIPLWLKATSDSAAGIRGAGFECLSHVRDRKHDAVIAKALDDADETIRKVYAPLWQKNGGRA